MHIDDDDDDDVFDKRRVKIGGDYKWQVFYFQLEKYI